MAAVAQTYKNHAKLVPLFHFVLLPILLLNFLAMAYHLWREPSMFTGWSVVGLTGTFYTSGNER